MPELTANGVRLSYQVDRPAGPGAGPGGTGPSERAPVVLVCGTGQPAISWQLSLVPGLLAAGYPVVTFDSRGVAPSEAPPPPYSVADLVADTAGLIEGLEVGRCWVAGLSLGALVAQELALARPDLLQGAVMMGTVGRTNVTMRAWADAQLAAARAGMVLAPELEAVTVAMQVISPPHQLDDAFMGPWLELMAAGPPWDGPGREGQYAAEVAYDHRLEALAGVGVPSLVVAFQHDIVTPPAFGREVAEAIPGARYVEIPGLGHLGPMEDPEAVLPVLLDFFTGG